MGSSMMNQYPFSGHTPQPVPTSTPLDLLNVINILSDKPVVLYPPATNR